MEITFLSCFLVLVQTFSYSLVPTMLRIGALAIFWAKVLKCGEKFEIGLTASTKCV